MKHVPPKHILLFEQLTLIYWFSISVFGPYIVPYLTQLGANNAMVGLVCGAYGLSMALLLIPVGILSDKINNRKLFIILGCIAACTAVGGMWLTTNVWLMLVFRFLLGASLSGWVCFTVLFGSYYPPKDSIKAQGVLTAYDYLGQAISYVVAALCGSIFGMRSTFGIGFIVCVFCVILSFFVKETPIPNSVPRYTVSQMLRVAKDPWIIKVSIMGFVFQFVLLSAFVGFTAQIATKLGANAFQLSILAFIFVFASIPTSYFCGQFFSRKFGERKSLFVSSFLYAVFCILQPFSPTLMVLFILQGAAGFVRGVYYPMLVGMAIKKTPYEKQAAAMGVFQAVYSLGTTLGPIFMGILSQIYSLTAAFCITGIIGMITPMISLFGLKKE